MTMGQRGPKPKPKLPLEQRSQYKPINSFFQQPPATDQNQQAEQAGNSIHAFWHNTC
jgi:hypothetical protein